MKNMVFEICILAIFYEGRLKGDKELLTFRVLF